MTGTSVGYVYSELQVVERCLDDANSDLVGRHVVAIRIDLSNDKPSRALMLTMRDAFSLYRDLGRVLEEHDNL